MIPTNATKPVSLATLEKSKNLDLIWFVKRSSYGCKKKQEVEQKVHLIIHIHNKTALLPSAADPHVTV